MEKFIWDSTEVKRTPPKPIRSEHAFEGVRYEEEKLIFTIEFSGYGDTTKLTTSELHDMLMQKIGTELCKE